jgi:GDP-L-fucose synthase
MNIFLTGGNGMLGRAILRIAKAEFPTLTFMAPSRKEIALEDSVAVNSFYANNNVDLVLHAAAKVGGIAANIADPVSFLTENLAINNNVISGAHSAGVKQLLFFGSSCMYPKDYRQPLVESDLLAAPLEPTNEGYALAKITGAKLCEYIDAQSDRDYKTVIPCNLFGTEDHFGSNASHLIAAIVSKVVDAQFSNKSSVTIWGSGQARREFLFVDDLARFILENINQVSAFPNYMNLGSGADFCIDQYYKIVSDVAKYEGAFKYDTNQPEGMMQKLMDSSLAENLLDWSPRTPMQKAIELVVDAYRKKLAANATNEGR